MSRPDNPRFPHTCKIWRLVDKGPLEDQNTDYNPLEDEEEVSGSTEGSTDESDVVIIYEGKCRAYDRQTTSDKGDVITSYRGLALPITRDGWTELGVVPETGDKFMVDRGCDKEFGSIIDKNPGNFGGTHLVLKYGRN